jgi:hypothetical protein
MVDELTVISYQLSVKSDVFIVGETPHKVSYQLSVISQE